MCVYVYMYIIHRNQRPIWVSLMWILEKYNDITLKRGIAYLGRSHRLPCVFNNFHQPMSVQYIFSIAGAFAVAHIYSTIIYIAKQLGFPLAAEDSQRHAAGQAAREQRRRDGGKVPFAEALRLLVDQEIDLGKGRGPFDHVGPVYPQTGWIHREREREIDR